MVPTRPSKPVPVAFVDGVAFERARTRGKYEHIYRRLAFLPEVGCGVWSAVLTVHGQPILGPIAALVWFEFALLSWRLAGLTRGVAEDVLLAQRVASLLRYVCHQARCEIPRISLRNDMVRSAAVMWSGAQAVLILSCDFAHRLTDDELRGIIAHEVAHVAYGDLDASRRRRAFASVAIPIALVAAVIVVPDARGLFFTPGWAAMCVVGSVLGRLAIAPLNRPRETRADAYAAVLCTDPAAVGRALEKVGAFSEEARSAIFGRPPLRWLLSPMSWRMPTHPPIAQRVERLSPSVFAASTVTPPSPRGERPPASNLTKIGAVVTLLAGFGVAGATLLPWMVATDSTFAFLSWSFPGTYRSGGVAAVAGLIIAVLALYLARGAFWPRDRLVVSVFMVTMSLVLIVVLTLKIHEIMTWSSMVTGLTVTPALGLFIAATCVATTAIGSVISVYAAFVSRRQTSCGRGMNPAAGNLIRIQEPR